jgi:hypothetical protein
MRRVSESLELIFVTVLAGVAADVAGVSRRCNQINGLGSCFLMLTVSEVSAEPDHVTTQSNIAPISCDLLNPGSIRCEAPVLLHPQSA